MVARCRSCRLRHVDDMRGVRAISIGATLPTIFGPAAVRQAERDAMRAKIFAVEQDAAPSASAAPRPALIRPALIDMRPKATWVVGEEATAR